MHPENIFAATGAACRICSAPRGATAAGRGGSFLSGHGEGMMLPRKLLLFVLLISFLVTFLQLQVFQIMTDPTTVKRRS